MTKPFNSFYYDIEVITPVHVGGAKENDYIIGQDYFYEDGKYCFVDKTAIQRSLTNLEIASYSNALIGGNFLGAAQILKNKSKINQNYIIHTSSCSVKPQSYDVIKRHIGDGMGNLYIPGSSVKGAIAGVIGTYLMRMTNQNEFRPSDVFGNINNNLMRYVQVGDMIFNCYGEVTPIKVFSGDINGNYNTQGTFSGEGKWKDQSRGGHNTKFNENNFVTLQEALIEGSTSKIRINWADGIIITISNINQQSLARNVQHFENFSGNNLLSLIHAHTNRFLEQEIEYFQKFTNEYFYDAVDHLNDLKSQNKPNAPLLRIGSGSGFHAITGNWKFNNHVTTGQVFDINRNPINAINYKTRKVSFFVDDEDYLRFQLPGFIKLTPQ